MVMRPAGVIVAGCGPHYRTRYHAVIEDYVRRGLVEIALVVDLHDKADQVRAFFAGRAASPRAFLFLDEGLRDPDGPDAVDRAVSEAGLGDVSASMMVLCTEPKAHRAYALWAIGRGLHVFCDKPVTAPHGRDAGHSFVADLEELLAAQARAGTRVTVSCERRASPGYRYVFSFLEDIMRTHDVPITGVQIHFAGGVWNALAEYATRENHPYKYGYGVLLHSGYHYIDLLVRFLALNEAVADTDILSPSIQAMARQPHAVAPFHPRLRGEPDHKGSLAAIQGETDILMIGSVGGRAGPTTMFSVQLTDVSVSRRFDGAGMSNPYVQGGRVRQESVILHLGHLCSLQISSDSLPPRDTGTSENFDLVITRNLDRAPGGITDRMGRADLGARMGVPADRVFNIAAREHQLRTFLDGQLGCSPLATHRPTAVYLDAIWRALVARVRDGAPDFETSVRA